MRPAQFAGETHLKVYAPGCEYHMKQSGEHVAAQFIGITIFGNWALMCQNCFELYGTGMGPGKGHILAVGGIQ